MLSVGTASMQFMTWYVSIRSTLSWVRGTHLVVLARVHDQRLLVCARYQADHEAGLLDVFSGEGIVTEPLDIDEEAEASDAGAEGLDL